MLDSGLSEREREILRLVATGASNKEIAQQLSISANTVKVHLRNIFAKTGVVSRTEATLYAIRTGIASVEGAHEEESRGQAVATLEQPPVAFREVAPVDAVPHARRHVSWILPTIIGIIVIAVVVFAEAMRQQPPPVSASPPAPVVSSRWQARPTIPSPTRAHAGAAYENQIYIVGGETPSGVSAVVEKLDLRSGTWTTVAQKPTATADSSAAVLGGRIYVPGGRTDADNTRISDLLEVYDPRQDKWEQRAHMPKPISAYALSAFEGKLYVFGGWDGVQFLDTVYEYDPNQDVWQTLAPMRRVRGYAVAAVVGGKIYIIGGYDGKNALTMNESYIPAASLGDEPVWASEVPLPTGRYAMGAASISNIIYVVGGLGSSNTSLTPLEYQTQQAKWVPFESPFSSEWSRLLLVSEGVYLYGLGGTVGDSLSDRSMSYQALYTILVPMTR